MTTRFSSSFPASADTSEISAEPAALEIHPPYGLRDTAGRSALLHELTEFVIGLEDAAQIWHGPVPCKGKLDGAGAAADLTRELTAASRPRATLICRPDAEIAAESVAESRTHLTLADGRVARVLAITEWPAAVTPNWLADVTASCAAVAFHLRPVPAAVAARLLRRRLAAMTSTAYVDDEAGRLSDPALAVATRAADDLRHAVAAGTTRLVQVQLLLAITAEREPELDSTQEDIRQRLAPSIAAASVLHLEQAPAWAAVAQGGNPLSWPWRLLDAATVAATLPHPVGPTMTPGTTGTLVGREPESGVPCVVDRFALHNANRLVVGTSGAGKSYATKLELLRQLAAGSAGIVIDPEGEFGRLADVTRGLTLAVGEEPAGLDPVGLACREALPAAEGMSVLASWAGALLGQPLSSVDLALLDRALSVLRADRATTPSAADLLALIADVSAHPPFRGATLAARLDPAANGTIAALFAPNPDLADPPALVVFDLRAVPGRVRPAVMSCVLAWTWCQTVAQSNAQRRLVVIDEAHLLLEDPAAAELLAQFARRARKYGVGLDVVTQRLSDFLRHTAGEAVLANTASKLLLGCEDREREAVIDGLGLTPPEADLLRPGTRGRGLLITPSLRTPVDIVAADAEHVLAAAGPR